MPSNYVATFRATYTATHDAEAQLIADTIVDHGQEYLDQDDEEGHELMCTQVTSLAADLTPTEVVTRLRQARNDLIRTGYRDCYAMARELDRISWALECRIDPIETPPSYDWGMFIEVAQAIIQRKENPI